MLQIPSTSYHQGALQTSTFQSTNETPSITAADVFDECLHQRLEPLPESVSEICPDEVALFTYLDNLQHQIDDNLYSQQLMMNDAWEQFSSLEDNKGVVSNQQILRIHIYNLHHNQKTRYLDLDSYSTQNLTAVAPPRWVLRIQGRLLGQFNRNYLPSQMTSFFEKIIISTKFETVTWNRNVQSPQRLLEVPCKNAMFRGLNQQHNKVVKTGCSQPFLLINDFQDVNPENNNTEPGRVEHLITESQSSLSLNQAEIHSDQCRTLQLIDATASEGLIRGLVDCDGIEYAVQGDEEEVVQVIFFPSYRVPHFNLSHELEEVVGVNPASLTTIVEAIWLRAKKSSGSKQRMTSDFTQLPCDPVLQKVLGISCATFNFADLRALLGPHLSPVSPIIIEHQIKLTGDIIDNEQILDYSVNVSGILFPVFSKISPWASTSMSAEKTPPSVETGIPVDSQMSPPQKTSSLHHSEPNSNNCRLFGLSDCNELSVIWNELVTAVSKRNLYLEFAGQPDLLMERLLTSRQMDVVDYGSILASSDFLREYEVGHQKPEFYQQPWVVLAVESYLANRKKNLDELIGKNLSANATDRRNFINLEWKDPIADALRAKYTSKRPVHSEQLQQQQQQQVHYSSNGQVTSIRVPVFSQMSRQHHMSGMYLPGTYTSSPDPRLLLSHHHATSNLHPLTGFMTSSNATFQGGVPAGMATSRFLPFPGGSAAQPNLLNMVPSSVIEEDHSQL